MIDLYAIPAPLVENARHLINLIIPQAQQRWSASLQPNATRCQILWCSSTQRDAVRRGMGLSAD
jgi:hypothetical protein